MAVQIWTTSEREHQIKEAYGAGAEDARDYYSAINTEANRFGIYKDHYIEGFITNLTRIADSKRFKA